MTLSELLSKPEFWSALFGAAAAFLLGALGTWWLNTSAKRTTGNLTLVLLGQMYGLMENLRHRMFVEEANRFLRLAGRPPLSFQLRGIVGIPARLPQLPFDELGFLAESRDPDLMSRLLQAERAFNGMIDLARRHRELHSELAARLDSRDRSGRQGVTTQDVVDAVGMKVLIEIADAVDDLRTGLPDTRDSLLRVSGQLRDTLRLQFPFRHFVSFKPAPRSPTLDQPPGLPDPAVWRCVARWVVDLVREPTPLPVWMRPTPAPQPVEQQPPEVIRFPPRS